ncbi:MAG: hypothetical protein H7242_16815 [Microbacteriaceae bacterium]|nr:hypothetical protein [Burkholderiaceae bacterium]
MTQSLSRRQILLTASATLLPTLSTAQAAWPSKPIRLLTPFTVGGASDVIARSLAMQLQAAVKQTVNVDP